MRECSITILVVVVMGVMASQVGCISEEPKGSVPDDPGAFFVDEEKLIETAETILRRSGHDPRCFLPFISMWERFGHRGPLKGWRPQATVLFVPRGCPEGCAGTYPVRVARLWEGDTLCWPTHRRELAAYQQEALALAYQALKREFEASRPKPLRDLGDLWFWIEEYEHSLRVTLNPKLPPGVIAVDTDAVVLLTKRPLAVDEVILPRMGRWERGSAGDE